MMTKIAINGFGRIGRLAFRIALEKGLKIVAINDLTETKVLAHLLKYDSLYGRYEKEVSFDEKNLIVDGKKIKVFAEKDPANLPWRELGIDIVLESSGVFTHREGAEKHLQAGAKRVIISAPPKTPDIPTYILGVNEEKFNPKKDLIISNSSCTTNCLAPIVKIIHQNFIIQKGFFTTTHAYTNDQRLLDLSHQDLRRARAANLSIIPTSTGAAKSINEVIPELKGKLDGLALRVPVPTVSLLDLICVVKKETNQNELNNLFKKATTGRLKGILSVIEEPLVSVDLKGSPYSAIIDLSLTMVNRNLIKVVAWYDNEWGYACRYVEMVEYILKKLKKI
ncbi:MAG: type I glyceraldehyde-3-phosphate dehydrogenase [Patescibacteria group bacterium]|nr:type I glyceraldehyde-3-phosphate dehydrogenase [Patescibacteria group bacterium]